VRNLSTPVKITATRIDKRLQWSQAGNIWQNAAARTLLYTVTKPLRWIRKRLIRGIARSIKAG
jgi:hypothetical protein